MSKYFKEIALKEWDSDDITHLDFIVHVEENPFEISVVIRDSRKEIKHTVILDIYSETEKEALIKGFCFFADTLEKSDSLDECR